jgi:hypothetical protein
MISSIIITIARCPKILLVSILTSSPHITYHITRMHRVHHVAFPPLLTNRSLVRFTDRKYLYEPFVTKTREATTIKPSTYCYTYSS